MTPSGAPRFDTARGGVARVVDSPACIPDTPPGQVSRAARPVPPTNGNCCCCWCSSCLCFFATAAAAASGVLFLAVVVAAAAHAAAAAIAVCCCWLWLAGRVGSRARPVPPTNGKLLLLLFFLLLLLLFPLLVCFFLPLHPAASSRSSFCSSSAPQAHPRVCLHAPVAFAARQAKLHVSARPAAKGFGVIPFLHVCG